MGVITADPTATVDNTTDDPTGRAPLVLGGKGFAEVTETVSVEVGSGARGRFPPGR